MLLDRRPRRRRVRHGRRTRDHAPYTFRIVPSSGDDKKYENDGHYERPVGQKNDFVGEKCVPPTATRQGGEGGE